MQHPSTEARVAVRDDQRRASQPVTSGAIVVRQRCSATIRYRSTPPRQNRAGWRHEHHAPETRRSLQPASSIGGRQGADTESWPFRAGRLQSEGVNDERIRLLVTEFLVEGLGFDRFADLDVEFLTLMLSSGEKQLCRLRAERNLSSRLRHRVMKRSE